MKDYPDLSIDQTPLFRESLERVADGRADLAVLDLAAANEYLRHHTLVDFKIVGFSKCHSNSYIGARRALPLLASVLEKSLASINPAERTVIFRRWVVSDLTPGGFRWRRHWDSRSGTTAPSPANSSSAAASRLNSATPATGWSTSTWRKAAS